MHENRAPLCEMCVLSLKMVKIQNFWLTQGSLRASPIQENPILMSKKYFDKTLSFFFRGQAIKTSPKSMKTVLQCAKCVFRPLKWSKFAIEGSLRASPVQENPNLKSKNYFNKSLLIFCQCQATKTSPEIMIIVLQGTKRVFWGPQDNLCVDLVFF